MPRTIRVIVLVLAALFVLSGTALVVLYRSRPAAAPADDSLSELSFPPFSLTTQDGTTITNEWLKGRVTVVDFIFTNCPFICPTLTQKMRDLSRRLAGTEARFLSISVDPLHDTPGALAGYAARNDADLARWTFATGDQQTITRIVRDGLKFALYADTRTPVSLPDGSTMDNIVHPPFFVLVGPDGRVVGLFPVVAVPESIDEAVDRTQSLLKTMGR